MLHVVNKSPFERNCLESCVRLSQPGSCILLIEDGVYGSLIGGKASEVVQTCLEDRRVCVLGEDLQARGIEPDRIMSGVEMVDYAGFVRLAAEHPKVQSWL